MSQRCNFHHTADSSQCPYDEAIADVLDTLRDLEITPIPAVLDDLTMCDPCTDHYGIDPEVAVARLVRGDGQPLEDVGPLHVHGAVRFWRRRGPVGVLVPACALTESVVAA